MKNLVSQIGGFSPKGRRNRAGYRAIERLDIQTMMGMGIEHAPQRYQVAPLGGLIKGDTQVVGADDPQVNSRFARPGGKTPS